jgi:hypothetical protein
MFAEIVNISYGVDLKTPSCLSTYENLLNTYVAMLQCAVNFNNSLADLYFNHILSNGNPDVYSIDFASFDASDVVNKFDARLKYQISNLSQSFVETKLDNSNFIESVVAETNSVVLSEDSYSANISAIQKIINVQEGSERANHQNNKEAFYFLAIQAHNIQSSLSDERSKFISACNSIHYGEIVSKTEQTPNEEVCVSIITNHKSLVLQYNGILVQMLNIITGV